MKGNLAGICDLDDESFAHAHAQKLPLPRLYELRIVVLAQKDAADIALARADDADCADAGVFTSLEEIARRKKRQLYWVNGRIATMAQQAKDQKARKDEGPDPEKEARRKDFYLNFFLVANRELPRDVIKRLATAAAKRSGTEPTWEAGERPAEGVETR